LTPSVEIVDGAHSVSAIAELLVDLVMLITESRD